MPGVTDSDLGLDLSRTSVFLDFDGTITTTDVGVHVLSKAAPDTWRVIDEQFRSGQEEALEALNTKAQGQNIAILRTPTGFTMAPMHEGKVVKPEVFNALPESMRKDVETKIEALQKELASILERMPKADKERRAQLVPRSSRKRSRAARTSTSCESRAAPRSSLASTSLPTVK